MIYESIGVFGISASVLFFIFVYMSKDATLKRREKLYYVCALLMAYLGLLAGFVFDSIKNSGAANTEHIMQFTAFLNFFLQVALQNLIFVILSTIFDFSLRRRQSVLTWASILTAVYSLISVINIYHPFIYTISMSNSFTIQNHYYLNAVFFFISPTLFCIDIILARRETFLQFKTEFFALMPVFIAIIFIYTAQLLMLIWLALSILLGATYLLSVKKSGENDILTGIKNRRGASVCFQKLKEKRRRTVYTIIYIDLDCFKQINDVFGHPEGDLVLIKTAEIIGGFLSVGDIFARIGGDEFLIIKREKFDIEFFVKSIRNVLELHCQKEKKEYLIKFSFGSTLYVPEDKRDFTRVLSDADIVLYKNKNSADKTFAS